MRKLLAIDLKINERRLKRDTKKYHKESKKHIFDMQLKKEIWCRLEYIKFLKAQLKENPYDITMDEYPLRDE